MSERSKVNPKVKSKLRLIYLPLAGGYAVGIWACFAVPLWFHDTWVHSWPAPFYHLWLLFFGVGSFSLFQLWLRLCPKFVLDDEGVTVRNAFGLGWPRRYSWEELDYFDTESSSHRGHRTEYLHGFIDRRRVLTMDDDMYKNYPDIKAVFAEKLEERRVPY